MLFSLLWIALKAAGSCNARMFQMVPGSFKCFLLAMKYLRPLCGCWGVKGKDIVFAFLKEEGKATLRLPVLTAFRQHLPHGNERGLCLRSRSRPASWNVLLQIFSSPARIMRQPSNRIRFTHSTADRYIEGLMKIDSFENIISLLVAVFLSLTFLGPRGEVTA